MTQQELYNYDLSTPLLLFVSWSPSSRGEYEMESHTNAFNTSQLGPGAEHSSPILLQPLFIIFAALAFLGNGLLCVVILCSPVMRRSSYNLLILNLAVTDMLAGAWRLCVGCVLFPWFLFFFLSTNLLPIYHTMEWNRVPLVSMSLILAWNSPS